MHTHTHTLCLCLSVLERERETHTHTHTHKVVTHTRTCKHTNMLARTHAHKHTHINRENFNWRCDARGRCKDIDKARSSLLPTCKTFREDAWPATHQWDRAAHKTRVWAQLRTALRSFLIAPEHRVHEQLCLLEIFTLAVWFLIDVFNLGEQLCSRPMCRRSDARNVGSAGYGSKLLIGWTLSWGRRRNKKEVRL